jgi:hypothetical protein
MKQPSVHVGCCVQSMGIWWQVTEPIKDEPGNFIAVCVIPGEFYDEGGDEDVEWEVGHLTAWDDPTVKRDKAVVVPVDKWPDEVCAAVALYAMGITEGDE